MESCPFCARLSEESLRASFEKQEPLILERIEMVTGWTKCKNMYQCLFFCDSCGQDTLIRIQLVNEPDPADWWKQ